MDCDRCKSAFAFGEPDLDNARYCRVCGAVAYGVAFEEWRDDILLEWHRLDKRTPERKMADAARVAALSVEYANREKARRSGLPAERREELAARRRLAKSERKANETPDERERRLNYEREYARNRRKSKAGERYRLSADELEARRERERVYKADYRKRGGARA